MPIRKDSEMAISSLAASLGLHRLPPVEDGEGLDPV